MGIDLSAYFERIGWQGTPKPDSATLRGLLWQQTLSIPFENFDVLLGRGIRLDLDSLQHKLVTARRGGYCFEHVTLFAAVLEEIGFKLRRHTARVTLFAPRTAVPRAHMILLVEANGATYLADPGFGAFVPRMPVPVPVLDHPSSAPAETVLGMSHALVRDGAYHVLRVTLPDPVVDAWATSLDSDNPIDFEVGNHFTATHPKSPFVNNIMIQALTGDGRISAMNRDVKIWRNEQLIEEFQLQSRGRLRKLVSDHFGFDLPDIEHMRVPSIPEWE